MPTVSTVGSPAASTCAGRATRASSPTSIRHAHVTRIIENPPSVWGRAPDVAGRSPGRGSAIQHAARILGPAALDRQALGRRGGDLEPAIDSEAGPRDPSHHRPAPSSRWRADLAHPYPGRRFDMMTIEA